MRRQRKVPKKIILGLTGSFGSGKTTVAKAFAALGASLIDADSLAHALLEERGAVYREVVSEFGEKILKKDKGIERKRLAAVVFAERSALKRLNGIMHPEIIRRLKSAIARSKKKIVILDAPLLLEARLKGLVDKLVVVDIGREKQVERLKKGRHFCERDILKRVKSQWPLRKKKSLADFIIDNNGSRSKTREQAVKIWRQLWKNWI
ncbi:MAG TPA: dephospho-CoA kinase [Candidatus Margulisiibacteriota bacterium]|nr:dephospho-CoA kinase [Candidatus Margulisiibacteriota bacterium]